MKIDSKKASKPTRNGSESGSAEGSGIPRKSLRDPIAIVGIGCRYPGASNAAELWQMLVDGREAVGPYPGGRFAELDSLYEEARRKPGRLLTDRGGFLADVTGFDSQFFGISPRESIYVDPQHRLLLEVAWEALEDAGQVREAYESSSTGVYVGLWTSEYENRLYESGAESNFYSVPGCGRASASGRLSFAFGLEGPSVTVDTACSSSLVAVHMGCQALWAGEIDLALAGGANLILGPEISELFTKSKMLSPDGRCKFGDASANGFVRSEGAGIVVLKRLSRALADKDPIYALIRGGAVNNDGHSSNFLTPSHEGQQQMLRAAWKAAAVDPKNIRYVEMHGTGTSVGDPVEIGAVGGALAENGVTRSCVLGSVKTNVGHTEAASGVTGLIKAALVVQHRTIPASLHLKTPNPKVAWDEIPVDVAAQPVDLSTEKGPIFAGVNSFGLTGTNAHIVLEEAGLEQAESEPAKTDQATGPYMLPVSARTPEALNEMLRAHLAAMECGGEDYPIRDVCYTASARRTHHEQRAAIIGENRLELAANLAAAFAGEDCDGVVFGRASTEENKIVFVAPGQGSQWLGMARELFDRNPIFRNAFKECDSAIESENGWSLSTRIFGPDAELHLSQIDVIQPALFTMSVALAAVWRGWGIEPDAIVGHSMGEVAAAHIAGILSLEDAVAVICRRSRLMRKLRSAGGMATVELPLHEVELLLKYRDLVSIGASNGPHTTVISGDSAAIEELLKELEAKEIYCRQIKVDVASHSAQVDPILDELFIALSGIRPRPANIPMLSTVTGEYASTGGSSGVVMDAAYWVENLRRSVLFAPAIKKLADQNHDTFVELSPHPILLPSIEATAHAVNPQAIAVASLRREKPETATLFGGLAALYAAGRDIAWRRMYPAEARCVRLPQYPFQRERCWPEPADPERALFARQASDAGPLLGRKFESSLQPGTLLWESLLDLAALPYLNDHRVLRSAVFPASGHIEMAFSAAKKARPDQTFEVRNASFLNAAYLPNKGGKTFQLALTPEGNNAFRFELRGHTDQAENRGNERNEASWTLYSTGTLATVEPDSALPPRMAPEELKKRLHSQCDRQEHYEKTSRSGLHYGPAFQLIEEAWFGGEESLCRVKFDASQSEGYAIHPALLDACFQSMAHVLPKLDAFKAEDTYLPVVIQKIRICDAPPAEGDLFAQAVLTDADPVKGTLRANLRLANADGNILVDVIGIELMRVARESLPRVSEPLYTLNWVEDESDENVQRKAERTLAFLSKISAENWVIFADNTGIADALKESLVLAGGHCTLVRPAAKFSSLAEMEYGIDPRQRKDLDRLFAKISADIGVPTAVVHLWTLDTDSAAAYDADRLIGSQVLGSQYIPEIVQAITAANWAKPPRLWLITAGAMAVSEDKEPVRIENAPMWGMGRAVAREHAELRAVLVDLSFAADVREARALTLEICANRKEDRIALRGNRKYLARLSRISAEADQPEAHALGSGEQYRLEISDTGIIDNIELRARTLTPLRRDEVRIEVVAAGLNFIDVTKVMGIYPGLDPADLIQLGTECAGRVMAVGDDVSSFKIGDEVLAITPSMRTSALMASSVDIPAEMVFRKPSQLNFEQAAATPIAFLTAYYSLVELAHIRPGEWVLIHAAAGGVGLAAIEIAKWAGANIIATAGSDEKADYLRSIGVAHILNSRSLDFGPGAMKITGVRGVDVVLNSLTGEFIAAGLETLAPYGRFIELGKRDIYDDRNVGLKVFRKNLSFHAVDLAAAIEERRVYIIELLGKVMRHIESGEWKALPVTSFSSAEPSVPFRFMAQARHIGKISIRMDRDVRVLPATDRQLFSANNSYLITGGLGGVALTVADWMARNGAGHLVLLSRRVPSEDSAEAIRRMEESGATVTTVRADVTSEDDLVSVIATIRASGFSLKGIMHAAAVVDDALIVDLSPERSSPVMAAKIAGAWNLHAATLKEELDFFVLFSSIAAIHPQPGMGSYAAANAFLDSFAQYRRALGKPATSVNWGGWDQIGLARAAGTGRSIEGYEQQGMRNFSAQEGLEYLRRSLEANWAQVIAVPFDWTKFAEFHGPGNAPSAFSDMVSQVQAETATQSKRSEILDQLGSAESAKQRQEILEMYLQEVLGRVLKLATHRIDRERPLGSMGLDSLMGLEFVRRLSNTLETAVPATVVFNYPNIRLLAAHLLRRMQLEPVEGQAIKTEEPAAAQPLNGRNDAGELSGISEEDALQALISGGRRGS